MNDIIIRQVGSHKVRQRKSDGYIDESSLFVSTSKKLKDFMDKSDTMSFINELVLQTSLPQEELIKDNWVHPQIAIHLAYWVSPKLAVKVFEWVKEWIKGEFPKEEKLSDFNQNLLKALNFKG